MTSPTDASLSALRTHLAEIHDLSAALRVLHWDQATYMPPGGAPSRARHLAALGKVIHERKTSPELGRLLDRLAGDPVVMSNGHIDRALIEVARRDFDEAVRVPVDFVTELASHQADTYEVWKRAREADDFAMVRPALERMLELSRRLAEFYAPYESIADPLIAVADYGMTTSWIRRQFGALRARLEPLVAAVADRTVAQDNVLHRHYPADDQIAFGLEVVRVLGYDFERGRQDMTTHPFMIRFGHGDIRITTRVDEHDLSEALFGTVHEAGHALYEQGIDEALEGTPLARGTSSGVHESQSRLWENVVGRSLGFWRHFYPRLQQRFEDQLGAVSLETFYRDVNRVERSLIRTDADELTYNLHVMLRFELELDLLEGRVAVADLPEAWADRMLSSLGVRPTTDRDGVLQDVHWFVDYIGGQFQGYTLGNIMSAQIYAAAVAARPAIPAEIEGGSFGGLLDWLRTNLYRHGRCLPALEVIEQTTGSPLSTDPYIDYLTTKYSALYDV